MQHHRTARRSFDAVVRERMLTIAREARLESGFVRPDPASTTTTPSAAHAEWRQRQARQQRYEAMVCEQLGAMWIDEVPRLQERIHRR